VPAIARLGFVLAFGSVCTLRTGMGANMCSR